MPCLSKDLRLQDSTTRNAYEKVFFVCWNTEKLELPSISQVQTRGPTDIPWYNHHAAERPLLGSDKLPALSFPHPQTSAPGRIGSQDSVTSTSSSTGSNTASSVAGFPTYPQPTPGEAKNPPSSSTDGAGGVHSRYSLESANQPDYLTGGSVSEGYNHNQSGSMNQTQQYMDVHASHLSSAQSYSSHGAPASGIPPYQYSQPPLLQSGSAPYPSSASSYPPYGYPNGVTSPQSATQAVTNALSSHAPAQLLPLPAMTTAASPHTYVPGPGGHHQTYVSHQQPFDTTGQIQPAGAKPRVTATLWEDEGSLCYQIEAKGICVARRDDNHMINGTKLLNVAGMTRGRRDGILKSEKVRHVVKIGPMHLKGVWIPFERALEFANKEKITELLYPLFVHDINALLYHPSNQTRTNQIVAGSDRRRLETSHPSRSSQGAQPPPLHHHHSMHNPITSHMSHPPSLGSHSGAGRPGLDRSHTFPTPPTSASSLMGINQGGSYEWPGQTMGGSVQGSQALSIDTGLTSARSMPTTPATTPPGTNLQSMQTYQSQPSYDSSKSYYSAAPSSQAQYAPQQTITQQSNMSRYGQSISTNPYNIKHRMGPPSARTAGPTEPDPSETKADQYSHSQGNGQVGHGPGEGEAEHEPEYINDTNTAYSANRGSYTYTTNPSATGLTGEPPHLSPEMTESTAHQNGTDRVSARTGTQSQWAPGYSNTPRAAPSSNLYNVMSDTRGTAANGSAGDSYSNSTTAPSAYSSSINGSGKRMRDEDDQDQTSLAEAQNGESSAYEHKRRKTLVDAVGGPVGGPQLGMPTVKASLSRRR
ncbi:hypothetical protein FQN52_003860 [Onygenales sp. PD_12]|nr:hypothetical protein FQN52_003860 [Onygenales sp. PD_12]